MYKLPVMVQAEIESRLDLTTSFADIGTDADKSDKVLGTMTDEEKRIYSASLILAHHAIDPLLPEGEKRRLHQYADLMRELMWTTIRETHGLWDNDNIGVRAGFVIVSMSPPADGTDFIKKLLGGGS